jgi:hypothetical protein
MGSIVGGGEGGKAFTRLDLVKHVLNVLIATLSQHDQLCLITFTDSTKTVLDLVYMTESNKMLARNIVKQMTQESSTYTGPAIKRAYEVINLAPKNSIKSIVLLTDGQDTQGKDILIRAFDKQEKNSSVQFNTFGFSNDIWSDCLKDLALKGNGIFGFIPDQSMIGTIFINFIANVFQVFSQEVSVQLSEGFEFDEANGKDEKTIQLKYGCSRNFMVKKSSVKGKRSPLKVTIGLKKQETTTPLELTPNELTDETDYNIQQARLAMLKLVFNPSLPKVKLTETEKSKFIASTNDFKFEFSQNPDDVSDNNEQIKLSLNNWQSWGQHYMRSFAFAHLYEQCLNFKSPSMKIYRTSHFDELVDQLTDIFITLPPPVPSGIDYDSNLPKVNMRHIMDRDAGCILESCRVQLANGAVKRVGDLKKDDILLDGSKVVCLVKSKYAGALVKLNDLVITPYHPIFYEEKWQFPIEIYACNLKRLLSNPYFSLIENVSRKTMNVCNLVLDKNHSIEIELFKCVTLGHGFVDEAHVVEHSYYGTDRVIKDLSSCQGWTDGLVILDDVRVSRDENERVTGMVLDGQNSQIMS